MCCWSTNDIVTNLGMASRSTSTATPYVYKALYNVVPALTTDVRQWTSTLASTPRVQTIEFMRLASSCPLLPATTPYALDMSIPQVNGTESTLSTTVTTVPSFTQATGNPDFNGFSSTTGEAFGTFMPTTQCKAWIKKTVTTLSVTNTYISVVYSSVCRTAPDLVYCTASVQQTGGYTTKTATVTFSSLALCKGMWTFGLHVNDGCGADSVDTFNLRVGCNRPPQVSAGCPDNSTWTSNAFAQVSLDGRATTDPDNFADTFYGISAPSVSGALTYAWSLISAPGYDPTNPAVSCPFSPYAACSDIYCTDPNSKFVYPVVQFPSGIVKPLAQLNSYLVSTPYAFQPSV